MINFNTIDEANTFRQWVNDNCAMLPLITEEPIKENDKYGFNETEERNKLYEQYLLL